VFRFKFALRTCSPAHIVNAIAAFDKAMLDEMEVIWNRGFSESQRELACLPIKSGGVGLPWAFVLAWPIYVASRVQSQDLQSKMATAAPFDFDSLLPILAAHPLLQHVQDVRVSNMEMG
jgi:hypothetical protein